MGYTHVTVEVNNLQRSKPAYKASFLVDTGAIVCLAPTAELRKAGIEPEGREAHELANGTPVEYDYGFARISFMGSDTVTKIISALRGLNRCSGSRLWKALALGLTRFPRRSGATRRCP